MAHDQPFFEVQLLDYELAFGIKPPVDRISIIKDISKRDILHLFAELNYRLKPKNKVASDRSLEFQNYELMYLLSSNELFDKYAEIASELSIEKEKISGDEEDYILIFTREACLIAIEEIVNSDAIENIIGFDINQVGVRETILKYILAVNYTRVFVT